MASALWPSSTPSATPTTAASAKPSATRLQARGEVPEQALVEPAMVVERVDDQLPAVAQHRGGRRQGRGRAGAQRAARRRAEHATTTSGGSSRPATSRQLAAAPATVGAPAAAGAGRAAGARRVGACAADGATRAWASWAMGRSDVRKASGDALDVEAREVGLGVGGIEDLAVEEGLHAARRRGRDVGGGTPSALAASRQMSSRLTLAITALSRAPASSLPQRMFSVRNQSRGSGTGRRRGRARTSSDAALLSTTRPSP